MNPRRANVKADILRCIHSAPFQPYVRWLMPSALDGLAPDARLSCGIAARMFADKSRSGRDCPTWPFAIILVGGILFVLKNADRPACIWPVWQ